MNYVLEPSLIVVENFYDDPWKVREVAEQAKFYENHDSGYFCRTKSFASYEALSKFEKILGKEVDIDENWTPETVYNGSFYIMSPNKAFPEHIHHDQQDMIGIVCLSTTPSESNLGDGTAFWRHKATGRSTAKTKDEEDPLSREGTRFDRWIMTDFVGHNFNTLILYPGIRFHSVKIGKLDRLNQLFTFNLKKNG